MGLRDQYLTKLILHLFQRSIVPIENSTVCEQAEFLWIDGSLFYRAINWSNMGPTWKPYVDAVCFSLKTLLDSCPNLRVLVFSIDKYGAGTIAPQPKEPTQAHRYVDAKPVENPRDVYQLDQPNMGISSTDTFGNLDARLAFNEMISRALETFMRGYLIDHKSLESLIIDGAVRNNRPGLVFIGNRTMQDGDWCPHSEGDVGLSHWLPRFANLRSIVYSCDIDLQQVSLQVVRRLCDGGKRPEDLPSMHLIKKVGPKITTFDLKIYYAEVCSMISSLMHPDDYSHPMDVWATLTCVVGNDFCAPWMCSDECKRGEKNNDGIRLEYVWDSFVQNARHAYPLMWPTTEADQWDQPWSVYKLRTWIYPIQLVVESWKLIIERAAVLQLSTSTRKASKSIGVMSVKPYVNAQVRRMAWAVSYYANAALIGDKMPRGTEFVNGCSVHGWEERDGKVIISDRVKTTDSVVCGLNATDAPTRPPTPIDANVDPLDVFDALNMQY